MNSRFILCSSAKIWSHRKRRDEMVIIKAIPNTWNKVVKNEVVYHRKRRDEMVIIKAIPNTWNKVVKNEVVYLQVEMPSACDIKIRVCLTSICKISVKTIYDLLLEPILKKPASQNTILNMLNLSEIDWKKVYVIPRNFTIETSLSLSISIQNSEQHCLFE